MQNSQQQNAKKSVEDIDNIIRNVHNKISIDEAHIVLTNNGTFEDFKSKSKVIGNILFNLIPNEVIPSNFFKLNNLNL